MDLKLKGLKAVLVGASQGIGFATARQLTEEGCDVAICSRTQENVDQAVNALSGKGTKVLGGVVDVTDSAGHVAWIEDSIEKLGGCDIFISFTSVNQGVDEEEAWMAVMNTDLLPMSRGIKAALPALKASKSGAIITISSTGALEEFMGPQPYNALKAAIINYTSALAQQLAPEGVRVNCISPGPVYIDEGPWAQIKAAMPEFYDSISQQIPFGRMGSGEELGAAISFLASPVCGYLTGANLVVDGGFTKRVQY